MFLFLENAFVVQKVSSLYQAACELKSYVYLDIFAFSFLFCIGLGLINLVGIDLFRFFMLSLFRENLGMEKNSFRLKFEGFIQKLDLGY